MGPMCTTPKKSGGPLLRGATNPKATVAWEMEQQNVQTLGCGTAIRAMN